MVVVTSKVAKIDAYSLAFDSADLEVGQLPEASLIRAHKLFTIDQSRIVKRFSFLSAAKLQETLLLLRQLFDHPALQQPDKAPQAEKV